MNKQVIAVKTLVVVLLAVCIFSLMAATTSYMVNAAGTPTFGYASIGQYTDRTPAGDKDSCRYQAPQTGNINSISMYIQTANAQVLYGIYTDNNGKPDQLLAQSNPVSTGNGNSWVTASVSAPVIAGKYYWLTILTPTMVYWSFTTGSSVSAGNGKDTSILSQSYGSFLPWGKNMFSMYANYASTSTSTPITSTLTATPKPTVSPTPITSAPTVTPKPTSSPTTSPTSTPQPTATLPSSTFKPVWSANAGTSTMSNLGIKSGTHGNGSGQDTVTITTAPGGTSPSGTKAFQLTTNDGRIELCMYPGSLIQNDFYFSWWEYVPSSMGLPSSGQWLVLFQIEGSNQPGWYPIGKISINSWDKPNVTLYWQDINGKQTELSNSGVALPRDQWVHFQWYTKIGTNGELACWMNGQQLWDAKNIDTSGLTTSTLYFMPDLYGMNGSLYIDNMALYNTNLNGAAP
jgi:hypothetical protein